MTRHAFVTVWEMGEDDWLATVAVRDVPAHIEAEDPPQSIALGLPPHWTGRFYTADGARQIGVLTAVGLLRR